jgi:FAD/FMN-containing dehydrogenase
MQPNIAAAKAALAHIEQDENPATIRSKSRDFFWYSPILKAEMDHLQADFVVNPKSEAEVIEVLRVCYAHDVPVTTRGAGTGNYGQAMPMRGGCVMHMKNMAQVKEIGPGRVVAEPGIIIKELDAQTRAHSGQELRMMPSTFATATIGGFVAGGSGGIGSCTWGALRDFGNIIRLRVVTMEAEPRVLDLTGDELPRVSHAFGTNGIITEIEMPLAPAYDWTELLVAFDDFTAAATFAQDVANEDGILIKLATVIEAPIGKRYFQRVAPHVEEGTNLVILLVAPHSFEGLKTFMKAHGARRDHLQFRRQRLAQDARRAAGIHLEPHDAARAEGRSVDHLPAGALPLSRPHGAGSEGARDLRGGGSAASGGDARKRQGDVRGPAHRGLLHARAAGGDRRDARGDGLHDLQPAPLHAGGRRASVHRCAAVELQAGGGSQGPAEPGKMIAWDAPDFDYATMYAYPGMTPKPEAAE